jgi:ribosomal protein L1
MHAKRKMDRLLGMILGPENLMPSRTRYAQGAVSQGFSQEVETCRLKVDLSPKRQTVASSDRLTLAQLYCAF